MPGSLSTEHIKAWSICFFAGSVILSNLFSVLTIIFIPGNILLREEDIPQNDETNDDLNIDYSSINQENSSDSFLTKENTDHEMTESVPGNASAPSHKENNHTPIKRDQLKFDPMSTLEDECHTNDSVCSHVSDSSLNNGEPKLVLIDYEYCSYNYRGFDLANHFVEWTYDYTNPEYPNYYERFDQYPTLEQKVCNYPLTKV